ncbi:flagellar hook assembly protein FlgD [Bacillus sp. AGMB 02131]|uniref:Basal-body rod modification protein FlgD n=1 Tax=Peribacillus faecalis TaxID=2772559 RepID=A0A927D0X8_9BACI|nr:flagellar hook assembly protein FlgD [Peribacillus faecalis]MBD3109440.1 flagellar hook assembly protein FlgD [Peribacillus faecalis]
MTSIDSSLYLSAYQQKQAQSTNSNDYLGKDAFLKILMAQLQNQDPMNPMEDKDFIAQMAQFSSLEQMTNMVTSFEKLANSQAQSQMIAYSDFAGKTVKWDMLVGSVDGKHSETLSGKGVIEKVQFKNSSVEFVLNDGTVLKPENISEVLSINASQSSSQSSESKAPSYDQDLVQASSLIGKTVSWNHNGQEKMAIVNAVSIKNGKIEFEINDDLQTRLTADQLLKVSQ